MPKIFHAANLLQQGQLTLHRHVRILPIASNECDSLVDSLQVGIFEILRRQRNSKSERTARVRQGSNNQIGNSLHRGVGFKQYLVAAQRS